MEGGNSWKFHSQVSSLVSRYIFAIMLKSSRPTLSYIRIVPCAERRTFYGKRLTFLISSQSDPMKNDHRALTRIIKRFIGFLDLNDLNDLNNLTIILMVSNQERS